MIRVFNGYRRLCDVGVAVSGTQSTLDLAIGSLEDLIDGEKVGAAHDQINQIIGQLLAVQAILGETKEHITSCSVIVAEDEKSRGGE